MSNIGACMAKAKDKAEENEIFGYLKDSFVKYLQVYGVNRNTENT